MSGRGRRAGARLSERGWLVFAAGCLAATGLLRLILHWRGEDGFPGDHWAVHHLDHSHVPAWASDVGFLFAAIGTPVVSLLTVAAACWFAGREAGPRAVALIVLAYAGVAANALLKVISGPTPMMAMRAPDGLNYPSGHTVYAVVLGGAVALIALRHGRRDIAVACGLLVAAMGPTRVVIETHFVSDVIAGYFVGFGWLALVAVLTGWLPAGRAGAGRRGRGPARAADEGARRGGR